MRKPLNIKLCECGCGKIVKTGNRFILGHNFKNKTEEMLQKMREGLKGRKAWNKGVPMSLEQKIKLSKALIGKSQGLLSKEHKKKIGLANQGKTRTKEMNKRQSKQAKSNPNYGMKNKKHSIETKKRMSNWQIGRELPMATKLKIAEYRKGRLLSKETKERISKKLKGENHPLWRGGISKEPYSFDFNSELKELIKERDGYRCMLCGIREKESYKKLAIHHIDYDKKNSENSNLITLCNICHSKTNYNRENWSFYLRSLLIRKAA